MSSSKRKWDIDAFDRELLYHYQADTRQSAETLGARIGLSATAVQRRLKRLRAAGIISAEVALLDAARLDLPVTVIVHVDLERESAAHIDAFKKRMSQTPAVQQCWYTTGRTDFVLVVRAASLADYEAFTRDTLMSWANLREFTSHVVLEEVTSWSPLDYPRRSRDASPISGLGREQRWSSEQK